MFSDNTGKLIRHCTFVLLIVLVASSGAAIAQSPEPSATPEQSADDDELVIEDIIIGEGELFQKGAWPAVHFRGFRLNGQKFIDSRANKSLLPHEFFFSDILLEGWVQGLEGLRVGGVRRVTMPPRFAFGDNPPEYGKVAPGETVVIEFEAIRQKSLPEVKLDNGIVIRRLREGEGHAAEYGDWIKFHIQVFTGEEMEPKANSRVSEKGPVQVAIPAPHGVFTGSASSMRYNIPHLDMILLGMKAGERRDVSYPSSEMFGDFGAPRMGIGVNVPFAIEFECLSVAQGPDVILDNGLRIQDLVVGDGRIAHMATMNFFHYRGTLADGTIIQSNWDDAEALGVRLYSNQIIAGLRLGLQGMRVGGERRLYVPASLAFGSAPPSGFDHVPPNSNVIYEVKLVDVQIVH